MPPVIGMVCRLSLECRMRRRAVPKNTEVIMRGEPVLINGGGTIKALSAEFLFDLQKHWRKSREQVLDDVAKKYPAQYLASMVTLAKVIRWEIGEPGAFDRTVLALILLAEACSKLGRTTEGLNYPHRS